MRLELGRAGEITLGMLQDLRPAFKERDTKRFTDLARRDDQVDILEVEILNYLGKIRQRSLTEEESLTFQGLMIATENIEYLADVIETELVALGHKVVDTKLMSSDETRKLLLDLYTAVSNATELAVQAVRDNDQRAAESVLMMKDSIRDLSEQVLTRKARRLTGDDQDYLELVRMEMAFVDQMRRMFTLTKRIAKVVLPPVLAQRD